MCLQLYIPYEYDCMIKYIDKMKFSGSTQANEVIIFANRFNNVHKRLMGKALCQWDI